MARAGLTTSFDLGGRIQRAAWGAMLAVLPLLSACGIKFPANTFVAHSDLTKAIQGLYWDVIAWTTAILILVCALVFMVLFKYSTRPGPDHKPPPEEFESLTLEIAWIAGPALVLLMIAIPSIRLVFASQQVTPPPNALIVEITGHQWWWEATYPQYGIHTANEFHLPVGRPVRFILSSADVIHSFWMPQLGAKRDVVPGHVNQITFTPTETGEDFGECAEFCGTSHANMRFRVFVDTKVGFDNWATDMAGAARPAVGGRARAGQNIFATSACTPCHTVKGLSAGTIAPDLTHFATRTTLAGGTFANTPSNVAKWITNPEAMKPGAQMPALGLRGPELTDLVAYLESLK